MDFLKGLVTYVVIPIILMGLLVVLTMQLLVERQTMIPVERPERNLAVGVGTPIPFPIESWDTYYGGGAGIDKVITRDAWSVRVSTGGDGGWYGARTSFSEVNLSESSVTFSVRAHDWDQVSRAMVLFSTGPEFSDYFGLNLTNYFAQPSQGEWIDVVLDTSEFEVVEGNPDWSEVSDVAIRIVPEPGISTRIWFEGFSYIPERKRSAVITHTFDDGFKSVMDAANIMDIYGQRGTAFIIPEFIETDGYLSQVDVNELANQGWDISGHGKDNLTELLPPDVDTHLAAMHEYLQQFGHDGSAHFAYPNGGYNSSVQSQVLEYFQSARTIDGFQQPPEYIYPTNVNAITISSSTPVTEVVAQIDRATSEGTWLVLVWHDFNVSPESDVEYHIDDFEYIVNYIQQNEEVEVLPYAEAYERFSQSTNG